MLVKTHKHGRDLTGLHIGRANASRYFSKHAQSIELRLDDLHIQCTLAPDFWQGRPEIYDPRLSEWLKFKMERAQSGGAPALLTMVPAGADIFVLHPSPKAASEAFGADVTLARKVKAEHDLPPAYAPRVQACSVA